MAQILVIDDEPAVREALVAHLLDMGHHCHEVGDGVAALEALHEREYDAIVTDIAMPRMNGLQLLERALPFLEQRIPVVVLSSVRDRGAISAALGAGAVDFLSKPAEPDEIRRVIEECLARRGEVLRLRGHRRAPGGLIPHSALGPSTPHRREAPLWQAPAGVPAFRDSKPLVTIPLPGHGGEQGGDRRASSLLCRVRRWFGRGAA